MGIEQQAAGLDGLEALASGDWEAARDAFRAALETEDAAELRDGLGRALWWLGDAEGALDQRERAYALYRKSGETASAARVALWLSREYAAVWANDPAASGWLARAERLLEGTDAGIDRGWLELTRAQQAAHPATAATHARTALEAAHGLGDPDLELQALAQLGLAEVSLGEVGEGLTRLDEAMAGATGGEPAEIETVAELSCTLLVACELAGDQERSRRWMEVIDAFIRRHDRRSLLSFCRTLCADVLATGGDLGSAERELEVAVSELSSGRQQSRCLHPATRLARIRVLQGRLDEAEELLAGFEGSSEAVGAIVDLRLARGEHRAAAARLERRLDEIGRDNLLAAPLLGQLVEARLADGDQAQAEAAADQLAGIAETWRVDRCRAAAALARGRLGLARGEDQASELLGRAAELFARERMPLDTARARLELARATAEVSREEAVDLARTAQADLERLGAAREASAAAALLRELGAKGQTGPKGIGLLTKREREVLGLVRDGLSNAEIAERLYISPKTAEHHVSRILGKLGVRSRAEAAARASRFLAENE